ncbi:hypothetical protein VNO77_19364 [Canavalia gladiata]|uniref:Uncharacterized protein n=1 Tax=Canavalia gladiata TaxID=3824 RepID=A0AAN9QKF0_CANGL
MYASHPAFPEGGYEAYMAAALIRYASFPFSWPAKARLPTRKWKFLHAGLVPNDSRTWARGLTTQAIQLHGLVSMDRGLCCLSWETTYAGWRVRCLILHAPKPMIWTLCVSFGQACMCCTRLRVKEPLLSRSCPCKVLLPHRVVRLRSASHDHDPKVCLSSNGIFTWRTHDASRSTLSLQSSLCFRCRQLIILHVSFGMVPLCIVFNSHHPALQHLLACLVLHDNRSHMISRVTSRTTPFKVPCTVLIQSYFAIDSNPIVHGLTLRRMAWGVKFHFSLRLSPLRFTMAARASLELTSFWPIVRSLFPLHGHQLWRIVRLQVLPRNRGTNAMVPRDHKSLETKSCKGAASGNVTLW